MEKKFFLNNISLELTTKCNLRCKHCSDSYGDILTEDMKFDDFRKIVKWANNNKIPSITLSSGEIFVLKDINKKLNYIRQNYNGKIEIITNGTLIDETNINTIINTVDEINISLDGYDEESVNFLRGKDVFKKVLNTVNLLQLTGYKNISLSMVLTSDNKNHKKQFKDLCNKLNVRSLIRNLSIRGRALENYDLLLFDKDKGIEENILKRINMKCICDAGISNISITTNGSIKMCSALEYSDITLGTINTLDDILINISKIKKECIVDNIDVCKECIVRYFCSSICYSVNKNIFYNPKLRIERCNKNKEILINNIWNIKK